jgi:hypothetical protein
MEERCFNFSPDGWCDAWILRLMAFLFLRNATADGFGLQRRGTKYKQFQLITIRKNHARTVGKNKNITAAIVHLLKLQVRTHGATTRSIISQTSSSRT